MVQRKPVNPFYLALVPVGVIFAITACAYCAQLVTATRVFDAQRAQDTAFTGLLERHGTTAMVVELVVLGILTVAAIASDDFWMRRFESTGQRESNREEAP
jgi:hypothetical protein